MKMYLDEGEGDGGRGHHVLGREEREVGDVDAGVDGDDAAEAEEDGARQRAVRVLDLLDHVVEEAPARVAVQGIIK